MEILSKYQNLKIKVSFLDIFIFIAILFSSVLYRLGSNVGVIVSLVFLEVFVLCVGFKKPERILILLILFNTRFFCLLPEKIGEIQLSKFEVFLMLGTYIIWAMKRFSGKSQVKKSNYIICLFTILIILFGALMAYLKINQSFLMGIVYQTRLLNIFIILPLIGMIDHNTEAYHNIIKSIIFLACIFSVMLILQVALINQISFLVVDEGYERLGNLRISTGYTFITIGTFLSFFMYLKKHKIGYILLSFLFVLVLMFIIQGRMALLGIFVALIFEVLLGLDYKKTKSWATFLFLIVLSIIVFLISENYVISLFNLTKNEIVNSEGNYAARIGERQFYLEQLDELKYIIFGRGYISPKTPGGELLDTQYGYYSITDIGITGLFVTNGIIGLLWWGTISLVLLFNSIKIYKKSRDCVYFSYFVYSIVICSTLLTFYYNNELLVLILVLVNMKSTILNKKDFNEMYYC